MYDIDVENVSVPAEIVKFHTPYRLFIQVPNIMNKSNLEKTIEFHSSYESYIEKTEIKGSVNFRPFYDL